MANARHDLSRNGSVIVVMTNDNYHTFGEALEALYKAVPGARANAATLVEAVHAGNDGAVWIGAAERANEICETLRAEGMNASLVPVDGSERSHRYVHEFAKAVNRRHVDTVWQTAAGVLLALLALFFAYNVLFLFLVG